MELVLRGSFLDHAHSRMLDALNRARARGARSGAVPLAPGAPCVVSTMTQLGTALTLVESGMGVTIPRLCTPAKERRIATIPIRGRARRGRSRPCGGVAGRGRAGETPERNVQGLARAAFID